MGRFRNYVERQGNRAARRKRRDHRPVGVDSYPLQTGVGPEDVETFDKFVGGNPTNVAVAATRFGHPAAVLTDSNNDSVGRFVRL